MKNVFKRVICSISIIFLTFSIIVLVSNYNVTQNVMKELHVKIEEKNTEMYQEIINQQGSWTSLDSSKLDYCNGMINILRQIFFSFILSIIIGSMIGLLYSMREFPKIKYIMYFITGNFICNTIIGIILKGTYLSSGVKISIFETFLKSFQATFVLYTLAFIFIIIINIIDNKVKVKKLNQMCNKEQPKK